MQAESAEHIRIDDRSPPPEKIQFKFGSMMDLLASQQPYINDTINQSSIGIPIMDSTNLLVDSV